MSSSSSMCMLSLFMSNKHNTFADISGDFHAFSANAPQSDSKQCLKESTGSISVDISGTGNHLEIPRDNTNLLCPEAINQRRNSRRPSILPVSRKNSNLPPCPCDLCTCLPLYCHGFAINFPAAKRGLKVIHLYRVAH